MGSNPTLSAKYHEKSHREVAFFIPERHRGAGRLSALRVGPKGEIRRALRTRDAAACSMWANPTLSAKYHEKSHREV